MVERYQYQEEEKKAQEEMSPPLCRGKIYPEHFHPLDFAADPTWLDQLFELQLSDPETAKLSSDLLSTISNKTGIYPKLREIQQYLHSKTYHISQDHRRMLFGHLSFEEIPYESSFVDAAIDTVQKAVTSLQIPGAADEWETDRKQRRYIGSRNSSITKSLAYSDKSRGKLPLQCAEEATLAAALSVQMTDISKDDCVFIGSPAHVAVFIRPSKNLKHGCLFDSKMLYFKNDITRFNNNEETGGYFARFGDIWFMSHSSGYSDLHTNQATLPPALSEKISQKMDQFFQLGSSTEEEVPKYSK